MFDLTTKHCVPCKGDTPTLKDAEIKQLLSQVPGWDLEDGKLVRRLRFKDFKEAMAFVTNLAKLAESENHHPNIFISYNRIKLTYFTHAIAGLSENDFIMAAKTNNLIAS